MRPGSYHLPFKDIQELGLPIVNFGPYGFGAHQRGERVLMSYSFGVLPQLLYDLKPLPGSDRRTSYTG